MLKNIHKTKHLFDDNIAHKVTFILCICIFYYTTGSISQTVAASYLFTNS